MNSLYIYELTVQSSFAANIESAATEDSFDTVQWWLCEDECWRIRTFDADSDIHVHNIAKALSVDEIDAHMKRKYADILVGRYDFPNIGLVDNDIVIKKMKSGRLEISRGRNFAFWNHDNRTYISKTNPDSGTEAGNGGKK